MPFRDAYKITGALVGLCVDTGKTLETLPLSEYQKLSGLFDGDVYDAIKLETCAMTRSSLGGPAKESVERQISWMREQLKAY